MTTKDVAIKLVEFCRKGQVLEAQQELYADTVTSIEPPHSPNPSASGKVAVLAKGQAFAASIEERHGGSFGDPIVNGDYFSITCSLDATFKGHGRMQLNEIAVYGVKEGKVVSEQFFY